MSALPASPNPPHCVLVVDDNEAARYAKVRILRHAGYRVIEAGNGADALAKVAEGDPDLVLLDVRLPDINGLDVCRRLKSAPATAGIPVLQTSASFRDSASRVAGLQGGADGYITEPVEPPVLVATIASLLRLRQAEQKVREMALEWQATFEAISDGVALADGEGRVLRANQAFRGMLALAGAEVSGKRVDELLPPSPGEADLWQNLAAGERRQVERTAGERTFVLSLDPLRNGGGARRAVCIVRDVTERKRMDQQLWHTQKLESIGLLAGGVAHDFNNLLTGIMGNASLGLENLDNPKFLSSSLQDIVRASERAADLTRQLLAYAGKGRFVVQDVDLSRIVREMVPLLQTSFLKRVELVLKLAKDLPPIQADKTQLEQIVMNVVINAAEAIGENGGTVTVTTARRRIYEDKHAHYLSEGEVRGDYVMLEIQDNGPGMDRQTLRQLFDPFFTTKFMGRGLGLSAVLGIMRSHQGAIRVESTPGYGTCFELLFRPAQETAPRAVRPRPARREEAAPHARILVVDDEPVVRDFFQAALRHQGYEVVTANNGNEALRIFQESPDGFQLVLLDLVMPVLSGKDVLPRLRAVRPDTPVVVTSGQVEEEVRGELEHWNVAAYVQKPCPAVTLIEKVREALKAKV